MTLFHENEDNGGRIQQFSLLISNNKRSEKPFGCWCLGTSVYVVKQCMIYLIYHQEGTLGTDVS